MDRRKKFKKSQFGKTLTLDLFLYNVQYHWKTCVNKET